MSLPADGPVVAVVPLRDGVSGKSRLASVLDPASRTRLVAVLARHVVSTLVAVRAVDQVVVVTADPGFARSTLAGVGVGIGGVEILAQPADRPGLNAALDVARDHVRGVDVRGVDVRGVDVRGADVRGAGVRGAARGGARLLVAHADLPALTVDDVESLLAEDADVVVATDRLGTGTNLLAVPGSAGFRFRFGLGSRAAHEAEAERLGLRRVTVSRPGTAVDLDTTDDWDELPGSVRAAVGQDVPRLGATP
ncbi:2-phospho-L-lactate guanylyltransferase [Antribacter gilvus]|uniref:2-phospho-L-lactate guanylyltransferase n=1 Tax=Antribacter gilvus TaxID=2304675 RepID=UPI001F0C8EAC|nr:2-phospho-L-lactate guanylyltransferase [Antribacter gilvus]